MKNQGSVRPTIRYSLIPGFLASLLLSVTFLFAYETQALGADVLWISDSTGSSSTPNDEGFITLLQQAGHTVTRNSNLGDGNPLTEAEKGTLEAADLVIISRDTNSGSYNDPAGWNNLSTPVLCLNAYMIRANRWNWVPASASNIFVDDIKFWEPFREVVLFDGIPIPSVFGVPITTTDITLLSFAGIGNGNKRASASTSEYRSLISDWQPGIEFYDGSGSTPAGKRMFFAAGQDGKTGSPQIGAFNLTTDGETLFLTAVEVLLSKGEVYWVSDRTQSGGSANDDGFVDLLTENGYIVAILQGLGDGDDLTSVEKSILNRADVVMISRDTISGQYNDPAGWNGLTAPLICMNPYLARSNRWNWFDETGIFVDKIWNWDASGFGLPCPPLGCSITNTDIALVNTNLTGNGAKKATALFSEGRVLGATWDSGVEFYSGASSSPSGTRLYLAVGENGSTGSPQIGKFNLTAEGETLFLGAVEDLLP